jgi:hypothetical protein
MIAKNNQMKIIIKSKALGPGAWGSRRFESPQVLKVLRISMHTIHTPKRK